ncbi:hypothetical protein [Microbulbifer hainanensis]|nr:hypothetical protein [Microbulbifer hainanensis]
MKTIASILKKPAASRADKPAAGNPAAGTECNYADNYYGDQVCVLRRAGR